MAFGYQRCAALTAVEDGYVAAVTGQINCRRQSRRSPADDQTVEIDFWHPNICSGKYRTLMANLLISNQRWLQWFLQSAPHRASFLFARMRGFATQNLS